MARIYSGDTAPFLVTCRIGTTVYPIVSATDTVDAAWIDTSTGTAITSVVSQSAGSSGAVWTSGIVAVVFNATESAKLAPFAGKPVELELKVTKPTGIQRFRAAYSILKGVIP